MKINKDLQPSKERELELLLNSKFEEAMNSVLNINSKSPEEDINFPNEHSIRAYARLVYGGIKFFQTLIPLDFIKLDEDACLLRFHNPLHVFKRREDNISHDTSDYIHNRRCPMRVLIWVLYITYAFYLSCSNAIIHWSYLALVSSSSTWNPQVLPGANRTDNCASFKDIYHPNKQAYDKVMRHRDLLHQSGILLAPTNIMMPLVLSGGAFGIFVILFGYVLSLFKGMIFDCPVFVFTIYPRIVRQKIQTTAVELYEDILKASRDEHSFRPEFYLDPYLSSNPLLKNNSRTTIVADEYQFSNHLGFSEQRIISNLQPNSHMYSPLDINDTKSCIGHFIEPLCFQGFTWKIYTNIRKFLFISVIGSIAIGILFNSSLIISDELAIRFDMRLKHLDCELWNPNGTYLRDPTLIIYSRTPSFEHRQRLLAFKDSGNILYSRDWIYCYLHEITYIVNKNFILFLSILNFSQFFAGVWVCFDMCLYLDGFILKYLWSHQIIKQLQSCLMALSLMGEKLLLSRQAINHVHNPPELLSRQYKQLEAALIASYCNFEILRRWDRSYRNFNEYICFMNMITMLSIIIVIYSIYTHVDRRNGWYLIFTMIIIIVVIDSVSIMCIVLMNQFQRIHWLANKNIGRMSQVMSSRFYLVNIWRRQLLTDEVVKSLYSTSFFGIHITRSLVISLNSYVIGFIMYLFIPSGSKEGVLSHLPDLMNNSVVTNANI